MARDGKIKVVNPLEDDGEGGDQPNSEPQKAPSGGEGQVKGAESVDGETNDPSQAEEAGKDQPKSARRGQQGAPPADQGLGSGGGQDTSGAPRGDEEGGQGGDQTTRRRGQQGDGDGGSGGGQKRGDAKGGDEDGESKDESPEQRRIRELEAELDKPEVRREEEGGPKVVKSRKTKPESELSPEERRIRELEDQLAKRRAKELEDQPETLEKSEAGDEGILIHFVEDGFTAQGRIWYRGQELEFDPEGRAYDQTKDREGNSWLDFSEDEQIEKYGKVYFKRGGWRGKNYDETEAQKAERRRGRAAPVVQG